MNRENEHQWLCAECTRRPIQKAKANETFCRAGPAFSWQIRGRFARPRMPDSGARARVAGTMGAVGVDVEGPRGTLDDLLRDHHFFDPLEARQIEHRVEQDAL